MNGDIKVELKGVNHPFAYYVEKPSKLMSNTKKHESDLSVSESLSE